MADWRTTVIVSIIIPLSLLFAFLCLKIAGMSANLLSLGAVDFGIIIDGAVVMVEGVFVMLDHKAKRYGMERFNKLAKGGWIKQTRNRSGESHLLLKAYYYHFTNTNFLFPESRRKNVLSIGLYPWICINGSFACLH